MMGTPEIIGAWVSIFLTLCIFSYLYGDNPVYKFAEHLFLGVSIGVATVQQYYNALEPNMLNRLFTGDLATVRWLSIIPLALVILLFMKVLGGKQFSWLARIPIAFLVAAFAGVKLTGEANGNLMRQVAESMPDLTVVHAEYGWLSDHNADYAGVLSSIFLVLGLVACLLHFYFSAPHNRVMRGVSRFGVLVLMLSFGASFGYTVMGRISLAIGRFQELLGHNLKPEHVDQVYPQTATMVSLAIILAVLAVWRATTPDETVES